VAYAQALAKASFHAESLDIRPHPTLNVETKPLADLPHSATRRHHPATKGHLMHRRDNGQPIREAMSEAELSTEGLAERTRKIDGYGISRSAVGHMVSQGPSGRNEFEDRSCDLVAKALGKPVEELFSDNAPT